MLVRHYYPLISVLGVLSLIILPQFWPGYLWAAVLIIPYIIIGFYDLFISKSNVLRNYPVIGHLRYGLEFISPEIRQYFIETNQSGRPFNREHRNAGLPARPAGRAGLPSPLARNTMSTDDRLQHGRNHSLAPQGRSANPIARVQMLAGPSARSPTTPRASTSRP